MWIAFLKKFNEQNEQNFEPTIFMHKIQEKMIYVEPSLLFLHQLIQSWTLKFLFQNLVSSGGKKLVVSIKELNSNGLHGQILFSLTWCNIITYSKYQDYIFLANMSKMVSSITNYIFEVRMK
jgi:hypothetical protein